MARLKQRPNRILNTSTKTSSAKKKKKRISRSTRSGLTFPVGRIHRKLRETTRGKQRISAGASVFMAATLEYLTTELMEMSAIAANESKKSRVTPRHLHLAIYGDQETAQLLDKVTLPQGGVTPMPIHPSLLPKKKAKEDDKENNS